MPTPLILLYFLVSMFMAQSGDPKQLLIAAAGWVVLLLIVKVRD